MIHGVMRCHQFLIVLCNGNGKHTSHTSLSKISLNRLFVQGTQNCCFFHEFFFFWPDDKERSVGSPAATPRCRRHLHPGADQTCRTSGISCVVRLKAAVCVSVSVCVHVFVRVCKCVLSYQCTSCSLTLQWFQQAVKAAPTFECTRVVSMFLVWILKWTHHLDLDLIFLLSVESDSGKALVRTGCEQGHWSELRLRQHKQGDFICMHLFQCLGFDLWSEESHEKLCLVIVTHVLQGTDVTCKNCIALCTECPLTLIVWTK